MSQVDILSGLGQKASAAIRVRHRGKTLLLDAGGPLHPGEPCEWIHETGPLDAILISHDHPDHIGSASKLPWDTPLYCTPEVADALPSGRAWSPLPRRGRSVIEGIRITTGLAGHSYGGVWLHLEVGDGLFYSGDASFESMIFPFDLPPPAGTLLLDASYGLYDTDQAKCREALLEQLARPTVLPLPLSGRAIELAVWLSEVEEHRSIDWTMDTQCRHMMRHWVRSASGVFQPGVLAVLRRLMERSWPERARIMLVADQNDDYQDWPEHQLLHTGYLTPERRERVSSGLELWRRWNVHLRASDLIKLRGTLGARQLVPLFTPLSQSTAWHDLLGPNLQQDKTLVIDDETETEPLPISASR